MGSNLREITNRIINFLKNNENKLLIWAVIIFLTWKIILVWELWHDRLSPPEPDDSFIYINHIESVVRCPSLFFCDKPIYAMDSYNGFSHLAYRIFFGYFGKIFGIASTTVYHLSFYIGSILLVPVLMIFLKSLTQNKRLISFALLFLMLPNGGGSTHSFFWIVPSYFALLIFLLICSIVLGYAKRWKKWLLILIPIGFLTHTITLYLFAVFPFFLLIYSIFNKKIDRALLKKSAFALFVAVIFYSSLSLYLNYKSSKGMSYGIEIFMKDTVVGEKIESAIIALNNISKNNSVENISAKSPSIKNTKVHFPGFEKLRENYLKWVILNPAGIVLFILMLWALAYKREYRVLSLFLSVLFVTLMSSIHKYAFRFLLLLWPMTFIFYAFGFWNLLKIINSLTYKRYTIIGLKILVAIAIFAIFFANMFFSLFWSEYSNKKKNYYFDPQYAAYLQNNVKKKEMIKYGSGVLTTLHIYNNLKNIRITNKIMDAKYYIVLDIKNDYAETFKNSNLNKFLELVSNKFGVKRQSIPVYKSGFIIPSNFEKVVKFGDIVIYKNSDL